MKTVRWQLAVLGAFLAFFVYGLNAQYPLIGHDYFYFFPKMLEGQWFFLRQGFAPMRWAIHLCGGFPQYGNPQDFYYSLPQMLSHALDLWTAAQITIVVGLLGGYWGWLRYGKDVLRLSPALSHLLAFVCTAHGFLFVHLAVGHLSYFTMPFLSWVLWLSFHPAREGRWLLAQRATLFGFFMGLFLYSGTHIAWFILLPLVLFMLPFDLLLARRPLERVVTLARRAAAFALAAALLGASKLVAVYTLMQVLPRTTTYYLYTEPQNALVFALKGLWAFPQLPSFFTIQPLLNRVHEESHFTSPVALVGLGLLAYLCWRSRELPRWKRVALPLYGVLLAAFIVAMAHPAGIVPTLMQQLPLFSSLRVSERFLYLASLFASVGGVWGIALFVRARALPEARVALGATLVTFAAFLVAYVPLLRSLEYTVPYDQIAGLLRENPDVLKQPVTGVQDLVGVRISDFQYIFDGTTGSRCYETLASAGQYPTLKDGPVNLAWSGALNVYNPACIHYGPENGCAPGDRVAVDDLQNLQNFINGDPTTWKISTAQRVADVVTLLALAALVGIGGASAVQWLKGRLRRQST